MTERIENLLRQAGTMVDTADVPADCRAVAFAKVMDLLVGEQSLPSESSSPPGSDAATSWDWMATLGNKFNKTALELEDIVFANDDGSPLLGIDPAHLGNTVAECSRNVILLLVGVRQIGGIETTTASEVLREECKRLGVYDQSNFGSTLRSLKEWFNYTGSGASIVVRLKPGGHKAFRQLLERLSDGGH